MNLTTWLDEQARTVHIALMNGDLPATRNALRFIFEDGASALDGIRPDLIIRLALFPLDDGQVHAVRDVFIRRAGVTFGDDHLDREIRASLYGALYAERH